MTAAEEKLASDHLYLAASAAHLFCSRRNVEYDDVYGDACVGLVQAAKRWRATGGSSFDSFAYTRIKGAIFDGARDATPLTRGEYARGETPPKLTPLHSPVARESLTTWEDAIPDETVRDTPGEMDAVLEVLLPRERRILLRLAAGDNQREVADKEGVTEGRMSQILANARRRYLKAVAA